MVSKFFTPTTALSLLTRFTPTEYACLFFKLFAISASAVFTLLRVLNVARRLFGLLKVVQPIFKLLSTHCFLYLATFLAILSGCLTNCLPWALPSAFALLVAAFSPALSALHAFLGKYRFLPSLGLPSEVVHSCSVHLFKLF